MNQTSTPVDSVESFLANLQQTFTTCKSSEGTATSATNFTWSAIRSLMHSSPLPLTADFCRKIHECCLSHLRTLEHEPIKQVSLGHTFVILIEALATILNYCIKNKEGVPELATSTFKDYVKCLSHALFFADFLSALSGAISYFASKEEEGENTNNNEKLTIEEVLSKYVLTMLQTAKRFDPPMREETRPAIEYIWSNLLMQAIPLYLYITKTCLPMYLPLCGGDYILSMFDWIIEYANKIMKIKDSSGPIQYCGKHCAMIYNYCNEENKAKLVPYLEKALENELVFYNICLYLVPEENVSESLRGPYNSLTEKLVVKLMDVVKEVRATNNEDQQLKGMTIANVYIVGLRHFSTSENHALAIKAVNAIKTLRVVPLKMKNAVPSAELIRNMLDLHGHLLGGIGFRDYYPYLRLCKQFISQRKFLLSSALLLSEYIHVDPPTELQSEYYGEVEEILGKIAHTDDPYVLFYGAKAYAEYTKKLKSAGIAVKSKPPSQIAALLLAMDDLEALEEVTKEKKSEVLNKIFSDWVQAVGTGDIPKVKQQEESKEEIAKRVIYKFVEIAKTMAPGKEWSPEDMMQRFEAKKNGTGLPTSQLKTFLRAELDKI